jgi:hypothetical protein
LKIAFFSKVPAVDLILGKVLENVGELVLGRLSDDQPQKAKPPAAARRWSKSKVKKVRQLFEALLKEDPPLPMDGDQEAAESSCQHSAIQIPRLMPKGSLPVQRTRREP